MKVCKFSSKASWCPSRLAGECGQRHPGTAAHQEDAVNERRLEGTARQHSNGQSPMGKYLRQAQRLENYWATDARWAATERTYSAVDVIKLRGSVQEEYTLARKGAERLWSLLHSQDYVHALGALTGNQAVQQVKAGLQAIYLSGWQVAADANLACQTYPDQSLSPRNSVPAVGRRISNALLA